MTINFPDTPMLNQLFVSGTIGWRWDGVKWVAPGIAVAGPPGAPGSVITVAETTALPLGFAGLVCAEPAGGPITVALPPAPVLRQEVTIKDTGGNASANNITVAGGDRTIEGAASLVLSFDYGWVDLVYAGTEWVQV
jgi:hypothetical protein